MLIKNIKWDTDGDMEALASLPTEVYTPSFLCQEQYDDVEEFLDDVSDFRTNMAGVISDLMSPRKKMNDSHSQTKTSNMRRE